MHKVVGEKAAQLLQLYLLDLLLAILSDLLCAAPQVGYIDDRFGPLGLAAVVTLALTAIFVISVVDFTLDMISRT